MTAIQTEEDKVERLIDLAFGLKYKSKSELNSSY